MPSSILPASAPRNANHAPRGHQSHEKIRRIALVMLPDRNRDDGGAIQAPAIFWISVGLDLRTIPMKVTTVTLVIDHIEPPSDN